LEKENNEILKQISETLQKINRRQELDELSSESNKLLEKSDRRIENALNQIQESFDRIHDKVFNFNNILIGVYLVLGTFPNDSPKLNIWTVVFPIINLAYMVYIDIRQMEIHRFASREQEWTSFERNEYGKKIRNQTLLSLLALVFSLGCLIYLITRLT
jgi:predicted nuclease with TOPRIM domain